MHDIIAYAAFLIAPALILLLTRRITLLARIGSLVVTYAIGIVVGNLGVLPDRLESVQATVGSTAAIVALPLLFFSLDLSSWRGLARDSVLSLVAGLVALMAATAATYAIFAHRVGEEAWKAAGMLVGVYTGGTPNLAAIGTALRISPDLYAAVHGSDIVIGAVWILLALSVLPRIFSRVLTPYLHRDSGGAASKEFSSAFTWHGPRSLVHAGAALGLALAVTAIGGSFTLFMPETAALPLTIVTITTLSVLLSLAPPVRRLENSFQLGYYLILAFSLAVSSLADVRELASTAPVMFGYTATLLTLVSILHLVLSRLFRIDRDTHLIAATAFLFSPPFIPVVAAALRNRAVIVPGIIMGTIGWVMGNYIGLAVAYALRAL